MWLRLWLRKKNKYQHKHTDSATNIIYKPRSNTHTHTEFTRVYVFDFERVQMCEMV